jgi:hypothetical protein
MTTGDLLKPYIHSYIHTYIHLPGEEALRIGLIDDYGGFMKAINAAKVCVCVCIYIYIYIYICMYVCAYVVSYRRCIICACVHVCVHLCIWDGVSVCAVCVEMGMQPDTKVTLRLFPCQHTYIHTHTYKHT